MAATQMSRSNYPSITQQQPYHTPQSNSPASVASPSGHDGQRSIYGAPSHLQQNSHPMYQYPPQQQYPPMPPQQAGPSPYSPHPQQQPHPQSMTSQPNNLLMSHPSQQPHPMQQHPGQHQQPGMTGSPRTKMEPHVPQIQRPAPTLGPQQHAQNGAPMQQNNVPGAGGAGVNPNAAPGPIPATTPLVVRQDNNGVQWIAFEYSRDRVKMEYTIRCDVESVNVETLSPEFKTENCVYPRACCSKDQYRGNRLVYETECNTVGWALAELNPCLRGKRGLIQRAVDSWRNSNQDPRLRSRRVRRMAKINNRKAVQTASHNPHMGGPGGPAGMPPSANMGPGPAPNMGKPSMGGMGGAQLHHHHQTHPDGSTQGDERLNLIDDEYADEQHHHHHQAPNGSPRSPEDIRQAHAFPGYPGSYPPPNSSVGGPSMAPTMHDARDPMSHSSIITVRGAATTSADDDRVSLFGDLPQGKRRKFIVVEDTQKSTRVRVRVNLDVVDTNEIPDKFREQNSVYPRSCFPTQMQDAPPSPTGSRFFKDDYDDISDPVEVEGRGYRRGRFHEMTEQTKVPLMNGTEAKILTQRMRKSWRDKEVKLNELGLRMTWHQSRVFADKTVFLQKALNMYRSKMYEALTDGGQEVSTRTPHFELRAGKRKWNQRTRQTGTEADN
ncbi:hypothetical protein B0O99DRAFT_520779 [Bisporella sp. PMI_857]|nr:hypothetical protein B0O99DRAFT_520779 [Bisporella sp. PMI_857]